MPLLAPPPEILAAFGIAQDEVVRRTTGGLINDTFILGNPPRLVVQRISRTYFTDPEAVMENFVRIVGHLDWKTRFDEEATSQRWFPKLHHTTAGKHYLFDGDDCIWRALEYIPGHAPTRHLDKATMHSVAAMYGRFLASVTDLGGPPLRPTVDWYRNLDLIREHFHTTRSVAGAGARGAVEPHLPLIETLLDRVEANAEAAGHEGHRLRAVHNDTKLDNVLMDPATGGIVAVIDLDVAMEGTAAHDFGDLLRSASQSGPDRDRPFDPDLFAWLAQGFVEGAGPTLTDAEIMTLPDAGPRICTELGLRYLTDVMAVEPSLQADPDVALKKGLRNLNMAQGILQQRDALQVVAARLCGEK